MVVSDAPSPSLYKRLTKVPFFSGEGAYSYFTMLMAIIGLVFWSTDFITDFIFAKKLWDQKSCSTNNFNNSDPSYTSIDYEYDENSTILERSINEDYEDERGLYEIWDNIDKNDQNEIEPLRAIRPNKTGDIEHLYIDFKTYSIVYLGLSLIPTYLQSTISFMQFFMDEDERPKENRKKILLVFMHVFPLHIIYRTVFTIYASFKYFTCSSIDRSTYWKKYVNSAKKLLLLKILDSCFESLLQFAFQLNLWLFEIENGCNTVSRDTFWEYLLGKIALSFAGSFLTFPKVTDIQMLNIQREPDNYPGGRKPKFIWFLNFVLHGSMMSSRALILVNLIHFNLAKTMIAIIFHITINFAILMSLKKMYHQKSKLLSNWQFDFLESCISLFTWVDLSKLIVKSSNERTLYTPPKNSTLPKNSKLHLHLKTFIVCCIHYVQNLAYFSVFFFVGMERKMDVFPILYLTLTSLIFQIIFQYFCNRLNHIIKVISKSEIPTEH